MVFMTSILLRELAHRGTIAAVAEALSFSPSAVSQQLSTLEAEAGVTLLERVGRRVRQDGSHVC
jgi:DNA-binding transcriptional LysR family regulator